MSNTKTAIVFGGSRGIGAAVAKRLAQDGFQVALTFSGRPERAENVVTSIVADGGAAIAVKADSGDPQAIRDAVSIAFERFGPFDAAVVNAGILRIGTVNAVSVDDLDEMLKINVRGVFLALQASAAHMKDGGRLITIGSNTAVRSSVVGSSVYAMTKAAVATMVKGFALDLAPRNITVNNIQPGPTQTDLTEAMVSDLAKASPLGRVGQPEEIAALASYLASDASAYMTGSSLTIDGGFVL